VVSSHSKTPLGVGTSHGHFVPRDTPRPGLKGSHHLPHIVFSAPPRRGYIQMALFPGTPKLESRNCPEIVPVGVPGLWELITPDFQVSGLWELITPDFQVWSRQGLNQSCSPPRDLSNDVSHSQFGGREEVDSWLLWLGVKLPIWLPALLLPITWAIDVRMTNARPFSISTLQELSNDTKNTPMRGVLGFAVEVWTFGSPGGLQILTFSKCCASPPHLAKVRLRQSPTCTCDLNCDSLHYVDINKYYINLLAFVQIRFWIGDSS
jgi:hypothetical protein